jgi:dolichyl-phosphate-mannose-protein mannosyltransferase
MEWYDSSAPVKSVVEPDRRLFWSILAAYMATWMLISWLSSPSLDVYGDMVENYAWSQTPAWGSFKHPPLFAWMVRAWFAVLPTEVWAYFLLSYVNAAIGVLGIVRLARLWVPHDLSSARRHVFAALVLLFAVLSAPYSNLAAKFNADTVLLSLWPWTAYAFFAALHADTVRRRWIFTLMLAAMGAAAMLGKYYSGVLLASLFIISLSSREYRRWYATPQPWIALLVFVLLLLPHVRWEARLDFPFREYYDTKIDSAIDPLRIVVFLLSGIYYLPLSWLAWLLMRRAFAAAAPQPIAWAIPVRGLALLSVLPALITAAFNVFARVHLTTHWAIPAWFALPVLLAVWLLPRLRTPFPWSRFLSGLTTFWIVLLGAGLAYTIVLSATGNPKYALGRQDMVRAIESRFGARFPGQRLAWAGGTWPESGALAFFAPDHPRALPGLPDERRALVNPFPAWRETYGVIVCYPWSALGREGAHDADCEARTREWLDRRQLPIDRETVHYRAAGWQFARAEPKNVTVFWVPPRMP